MEVLTGMLDTMDELRERARQTTADLDVRSLSILLCVLRARCCAGEGKAWADPASRVQRQCRDNAARKLPHLNSPANAIRHLVSSRTPTLETR